MAVRIGTKMAVSRQAVAVMAVAGPWMMTTLIDYLRSMLMAIPTAAG